MISGVLVLVAASIGGWLFYTHKSHALTDKDTIVLADFTNKTGDAVFDDTLKQALAIDLEQSPYLNIFSEARMQQTLKLMARSPQERITGEVAREICQRNGLKAVLIGSIASLGTQYVITLKAFNGATGDSIGEAQSEASSKEQVLKALDDVAVKMRTKLGESLGSIQKFDTPIAQATTTSLDALKAYRLGYASYAGGSWRASVPFFQRAIEIDPKFASAYSALGSAYVSAGEHDRALPYQQKAFELSQNISEAEKFYIQGQYYFNVTGNLQKNEQLLQLWINTYPRALSPRGNLAYLYNFYLGQFEKSEEVSRQILQIDPDHRIAYLRLVGSFLGRNRYEDAKAMCEKTGTNDFVHFWRYHIAIAERDNESAEREEHWAEANDDYVTLEAMAENADFNGRFKERPSRLSPCRRGCTKERCK